jgi:hypothetical protein
MDVPQFEVFTKKLVPLGKQPYVTIQRRGVFGFNLPAFMLLGSPTAVELMYDRRARIIGIRGVDETVEHAYAIRPNGGANSRATTYLVSGQAFTKYYRIDTSVSRRWPVTMADDVLCVDLNGHSTEVIGARSADRGGVASSGAAPQDDENAEPVDLPTDSAGFPTGARPEG